MATSPTHPAPLSKPPGMFHRANPYARSAVLAAIAVVMAAAFAIVAPFFFFGNASGHDFYFHLSSWMDAAGQWHQGVLYPRWAVWPNFGFGEPRFIFYPPTSWMLGAALGCILPWKAVPGAFVWLALTLAGASMFCLVREWMPTGDAIRAAAFYAVNPYHMVIVYIRSDFAELLASALFPLAVLYAARIGREPSTGPSGSGPALRRASSGGVVPLALIFAAIWLTNAPAAVIVTYCLLLLLAVLAVVRRSPAPVLGGGTALVLGFLLAGVYVVPATLEQNWVNIAQVLSTGLRPEQNFLFTFINHPEHNVFNLLVSTIATAEITITGVAALASSKPADNLPKGARELWWALIAVVAASVALMLPVTSLAWRWLPKLRFVQFPWRWLLPLGVGFGMYVAAAIRQARARRFWALLVAAILVAVGAYLAQQAWWDTADVPAMQTAIREGKGFEGTDEYSPRGTDHYDLPQDAPLVAAVPAGGAGAPRQRSVSAQVERWDAETKIIAVEAEQPATLALRLLNYPAWKVEVQGKPARAVSRENTGQMMIPVRAGRSLVRVRFARTTDRAAGLLLSAASGLLLLGLALAGRRRATAVPPASAGDSAGPAAPQD